MGMTLPSCGPRIHRTSTSTSGPTGASAPIRPSASGSRVLNCKRRGWVESGRGTKNRRPIATIIVRVTSSSCIRSANNSKATGSGGFFFVEPRVARPTAGSHFLCSRGVHPFGAHGEPILRVKDPRPHFCAGSLGLRRRHAPKCVEGAMRPRCLCPVLSAQSPAAFSARPTPAAAAPSTAACERRGPSAAHLGRSSARCPGP
jgi:hypothetical protein